MTCEKNDNHGNQTNALTPSELEHYLCGIAAAAGTHSRSHQRLHRFRASSFAWLPCSPAILPRRVATRSGSSFHNFDTHIRNSSLHLKFMGGRNFLLVRPIEIVLTFTRSGLRIIWISDFGPKSDSYPILVSDARFKNKSVTCIIRKSFLLKLVLSKLPQDVRLFKDAIIHIILPTEFEKNTDSNYPDRHRIQCLPVVSSARGSRHVL